MALKYSDLCFICASLRANACTKILPAHYNENEIKPCLMDKHILRRLCHFIIFVCGSYINAQNLISNPDFELAEKDDLKKGEWACIYQQRPVQWRSIGSCDYLLNSSTWYCDTLSSFTGNSFIGLGYHVDKRNGAPLSEYAVAELTNPLEAGREYHISFAIRQPKCILNAADTISIYLSSELRDMKVRHFELNEKGQITKTLQAAKLTLDLEPQLHFDISAANQVNTPWTKVSGTFTAEGGEKFMCIGFFGNGVIQKPALPGLFCTNEVDFKNVYYYVDHFYLGTQNEPEEKAGATTKKEEINEWTVHFDNGSYRVSAAEAHALTPFVKYLRENKGKELLLYGYTDSHGSEKANTHLAGQRVKSIQTFLIQSGVQNKMALYPKGQLQGKDEDCRKVECRLR